MIQRVDQSWAQSELIPFLDIVFPKRSAAEWQSKIRYAEHNLYGIDFYENFPLIIERLRLTLINPTLLTADETKPFDKVVKNVQTCVTILIRHAILHETFLLFSRGRAPNPDFSRALDRVMVHNTEAGESVADKMAVEKEEGTTKGHIDMRDAKEEGFKANHADRLSHAGEAMQRRQVLGQNDKPSGVGPSLPQPQPKGRARGKGKGRPRGQHSTGRGGHGFSRRPDYNTSNFTHQTPQGHPTYRDRPYGHSPGYNARKKPIAGFSNMPSQMAIENTEVPYNCTVPHHAQSSAQGMQAPIQQWTGHNTAPYYNPSYTGPHSAFAPGHAYHDPAYRPGFMPVAATPSHSSLYHPFNPPVQQPAQRPVEHPFQHPVLPLHGYAPVFQPEAGNYSMHGGAGEFHPGSAPYDF